MTNKFKLRLDIKSYWHPGTGKGSGSHVDAVVERDIDKCPFIAGRMLKGLLRDAVFRSAHWGILHMINGIKADDLVEILFGTNAYESLRPREDTLPGLIRLGDAALPYRIRQWLGTADRKYRRELFRDIYQTAINDGVARSKSLRGQQVVVPLKLTARMEITAPKNGANPLVEQVYHHGKEIITTILPLVHAVGAYRTRGLGRVQVTLEELKK